MRRLSWALTGFATLAALVLVFLAYPPGWAALVDVLLLAEGILIGRATRGRP